MLSSIRMRKFLDLLYLGCLFRNRDLSVINASLKFFLSNLERIELAFYFGSSNRYSFEVFFVTLFLGAVSIITSSNCSCEDSTKIPAALAASAQLCGCLDVSFSAGFVISVFSSGSFLYDRVRTMLSKSSPLSASCKKREMSIQATAAARPDIFNAILSAIVHLRSTSRHQMVTL